MSMSCRQVVRHRLRRSSRHRFRRLFLESLETRHLLAAPAEVGRLLYAGIADAQTSSTNSGLLMLIDADSGDTVPWRSTFAPAADGTTSTARFLVGEGISGLAFSPSGRLFATTGSAGGNAASRLVEIAPVSGEPLSGAVAIRAGQTSLNVFDLAAGPGPAFQLFGVGAPVGAPAGQTQLYLIDPSTGQAIVAPQSPTWLNQLVAVEGLAIGRDAALYVTGVDAVSGSSRLYIDTLGDPLAQPLIRDLTERVVGLDVLTRSGATDPSQVTLAGAVRGAAPAVAGGVFEIDPESGAFVRRLDSGSPIHGVPGDVAFYPDPQLPTVQIEHHEDFEQNDGGYWADNTGDVIPGLWHYSVGRRNDQLINHTPNRNWYYGLFETSTGGGTYLTPTGHQGALNSPPIDIPYCATTVLSFSYLLGVRESLDVDFAEVRVQYLDDAGQTRVETLLSRAAGTLPQTGNRWLTATADLSRFGGRQVVIQFWFDTGDTPVVDPEGWYVDDVLVAAIPSAACGYKWLDLNADGQWTAGEPGLNGWTIYADLDGNGRFDPATSEQAFAARIDANAFARGQQVTAADGRAVLEVSASGQPIWAMPDPDDPTRAVLARGVEPTEAVWPDGPMLRATFALGVHTAAIGVAATGAAGQTRAVLQAFDGQGNRIGEQTLTLTDAAWRTLTISTAGEQIAYIKASVDSGAARFNNLQYWGTAPAIEGDPSFITRHDGQRDGAFRFDRLPAGEYAIREVMPEGWKQSYPAAPDFAHTINITPGEPVAGRWQHAETPNFGNFQPDISGYKWHDENRDGVWGADETEGLDGWTIELYRDVDGDGRLGPDDLLVDSVQTAFDGERHGAFWFVNVTPGEYVMRELPQPGWVQSSPTGPDRTHALKLVAGQPLVGRWQVSDLPNFGNGLAPDLEIRAKTAAPDPVIAGQTLTYTIEFVNHGPGPAELVNVIDDLPEQVSFVSARVIEGSGWAVVEPSEDQPGRVSFSQPLVGHADTATFQIVVLTSPATPDGAVISNTATADSATEDRNPSNNEKTVETRVATEADLEVIAKTSSTAEAVAGQNLTYTIKVVNNGPSDAQLARVTDALPADVRFVSDAILDGSGWETDEPPVGAAGTVTFSTPTFAAGQTAQFQIVVLTSPATPDGTVLSNTAKTDSATEDPNPRNNEKTVETPVATEADLEVIAKTSSTAEVIAGQQLTYTIEVVNHGPSDAQLARVTDALPADVRFVSAAILDGSGWEIDAPPVGDAGVVAFSNPALAAGETARFEIVVATLATAPDGTIIVNTATIDSETADPDTANNSKTTSVPVLSPSEDAALHQTVQFITPITVYRTDGGFEPEPTDPTLPQWIEGYLWGDLNQDGVWDPSERALPGWFVFVDRNDNGVWDAFDPADPEAPPEPFAVTQANGRFVLDVDPGTHHVRLDPSAPSLSDGAMLVSLFPGPDGHVVEVRAGEPVIGSPGPAAAPSEPNFGVFFYSPFVRPADNYAGQVLQLPTASQPRNDLLAALAPWQSFTIANPADTDLTLTEIRRNIDTTKIPAADQFVQIFHKQRDDALAPVEPGLVIPAGDSAQFFVFYDPAIRQGDAVLEQYPDWFGAGADIRPAHTFSRDDHLSISTDRGTTIRVDLVGGSTYDSDIASNGAVDSGDHDLLDNLLSLQADTGQLSIPFGDPLFDPTADINARCPNGAEGTLATCEWALYGTPARELGFGDFGPLNVEWNRARAPFLDLDLDNSSGAKGVDYATEFSGQPIPVADTDARFANHRSRFLEGLSLEIVGADDSSDRLEVDEDALPRGIEVAGNGTNRLVLRGLDGGVARANIEAYASALRLVVFSSDSQEARTVQVAIRAKGAADAELKPDERFTRLAGDWELEGNLAITHIEIQAPREAEPSEVPRDTPSETTAATSDETSVAAPDETSNDIAGDAPNATPVESPSDPPSASVSSEAEAESNPGDTDIGPTIGEAESVSAAERSSPQELAGSSAAYSPPAGTAREDRFLADRAARQPDAQTRGTPTRRPLADSARDGSRELSAVSSHRPAQPLDGRADDQAAGQRLPAPPVIRHSEAAMAVKADDAWVALPTASDRHPVAPPSTTDDRTASATVARAEVFDEWDDLIFGDESLLTDLADRL